MQGSITGTITSIANGQGSVNNSGSYSFKDFVNDADKFKKGYSSVDNFITETKNVVTTIPNSASTLTALTNFQNSLKDNQFLKTGLAAVPWLKSAVGVLDFFSGGGKTSPQTVQLMPMAVNLSVKLSGTMQTSNQYHNITFTNPGSLDAQNDPDIYPFYNESLGVFNLLNTPKFLLRRQRALIPNLPPWRGLWTLQFKLKEAFKYIINPTSGLQLQDAQVAYVGLSNTNVANPPSTYGAGFNFLEGKDAESGRWEYRTEYVPIQCLSNDNQFVYQFIEGTNPDVPTKFYLKFILNFKRVSNPSAQNILMIMKYPIAIEQTSNVITGGSFNPNSCLGGIISQANASEVNTFCTSTKYTRNRANRVSPRGIINTHPVINSLKLSPNPASTHINVSGSLSTTKVVKVEIVDMLGKIHAIYNEQLQGDFSKSYATSSLANGVYIMRTHYSNGEIRTFKFIISK